MKGRTKAEALKVIQEMYIQLRSSGFPLNRLHMDRAREFQSGALETWIASQEWSSPELKEAILLGMARSKPSTLNPETLNP